MHRYTFVLCFVPYVYSACQFPTDLRGQWRSTSNGLLTFTNTTMSNYAASFTSVVLSFTCNEISGSNYVLISQPYTFVSNLMVYAYLCMQFEKLSSFKYLYTLGTTKDPTVGIRYYLSTLSNENASKICTMTDTRTAGEYELLVLSNSTQTQAVTCPTITQSYFTVVISKYSNFSSSCQNTTMEGRGNSSTAVTFNYSSCADTSLVFSSGGKFFCMYSLVSGGYTYLNLWNSDSSTNGVNTFTFTCMVLSKSDATVSATESPKACQYQQTPTYVDSTGRYYTLTDTLYASEQSASENLAWVALLVVFSCIAVVGVIVAILINILCIKKPLPIIPSPSPLPIVKKRKRKIKRKEWNLIKITSRKGRSKRSGVRTYTASVSQSRRSPFSFSRYDTEFIREYAVGKRNRPPEYDTHSKASSQPPQWQVKWETDLKPSPRSEKSEISLTVEETNSPAPHDTILENHKTMPTRHVSFEEKPPDPPSRSDTVLDEIGWLQPNERKNEPIYDQTNKMWPILSKKNSKVWYINVEEKEKNLKLN
ncbi:hypothetical protein CHS0354_018630 [Potamilus streckersoni]|uniref:Uncharacterized protein n=1 Tax=Potamilus streckersoni TaxID=2493646 RepID=A0AAE0VWU4_9BIVA|nr:hypothetical protein CHS0354_018630 [Potamilus streckersoni]